MAAVAIPPIVAATLPGAAVDQAAHAASAVAGKGKARAEHAMRDLPTPFGMDRKIFLYVTAAAAIL